MFQDRGDFSSVESVSSYFLLSGDLAIWLYTLLSPKMGHFSCKACTSLVPSPCAPPGEKRSGEWS